ncbi:DUF1295 domain-containing protein [Patescibacteria group bacterium]|nr:DUF1295 domain-containing protein [Patescibacteria group bacterium]
MATFITLVVLLFVYMNLWFVVSVIERRNDIADVAWGLGFVLIAVASFFLYAHVTLAGLIVTILTTIWGVRLARHISARHVGKPEDYRYAAWRRDWGSWFYLRSYGQIYLLQGALMLVIASPVIFINASVSVPLGLLAQAGLLLWAVGFFFETVADSQLAHFLSNPQNKGKLMTEGLWAFSRHPNYFGEVLMWWSIWLIALSLPYGYLMVIGPLTITYLIVRVSGVPMLEAKMASHPDFPAYKARTSMFIPLPPRVGSTEGA